MEFRLLRADEIDCRISSCNKYAILDNLISIGVYVDYEKYRKHLADKNLRKYIPPFELSESERYLEGHGIVWK